MPRQPPGSTLFPYTTLFRSVIPAERRFAGEAVDNLQTRCRAERHPERDRTIEFDDWRRGDCSKLLVERGDSRPVSLVGGARDWKSTRLNYSHSNRSYDDCW